MFLPGSIYLNHVVMTHYFVSAHLPGRIALSNSAFVLIVKAIVMHSKVLIGDNLGGCNFTMAYIWYHGVVIELKPCQDMALMLNIQTVVMLSSLVNFGAFTTMCFRTSEASEVALTWD